MLNKYRIFTQGYGILHEGLNYPDYTLLSFSPLAASHGLDLPLEFGKFK